MANNACFNSWQGPSVKHTAIWLVMYIDNNDEFFL